MTWFEALMGFAEREGIHDRITVDGDHMTSAANGRTFGCGRLETPRLAELRARLDAAKLPPGRPALREAVGDVQAMHLDPQNAGAVFQAASQFNLLEMTDYSVTPEAGVGIYERDRTQGPACAIACGAGTIYRNYFAPVGGGRGQTADRQIDCLADVGEALGNRGQLWTMANGYALLSPAGRAAITDRLAASDAAERDRLRGLLRVGLHHDVEVTLNGAGHRVTQIYGSALPVAYGSGRPAQWAPFARLVLEASYEATLYAAALTAAQSGNPRVFLTLLGGGVFGNDRAWIFDAITRALDAVAARGGGALDVAIVSYGRSDPAVRALAERWQTGPG